MTKKELDKIIKEIAVKNRTTPQEVRREMQLAMEAAMANPDPLIQARWKSIPHKGEKITLEEFIEFAATLANRIC